MLLFLGLQAFLWSRLGACTAETLRTPSKEVLIKKSSDLCELGRLCGESFFTE
jgi:hypothetical protein